MPNFNYHFLFYSGVKINGVCYQDVLLSQHLLPVIRSLAPEGCFVFQQDNVPAHRAQETIELLTRETDTRLNFSRIMASEQFRFKSGGVDYKMWSVMQERVYQRRIHDVNDLKQRLLKVWNDLDQTIIDGAVAQWRQRLQACINAEGGHFEHLL